MIYAGQQGDNAGGRMLSTPGMVWVGKISYSLYLRHWPLLVFAGVYFGASLGPPGVTVVVALSVLLAAGSTRFVERPFRGQRAILTRRRIFQLSAAGIALFVLSGVAVLPSERLCDEARCYFYRDGVVLYYDEHHLSLSGASQLKPLFRSLF